MTVELTRSQCSNVAEFIELWLFHAMREDDEVDNLEYLRDMLDAQKILLEAARNETD